MLSLRIVAEDEGEAPKPLTACPRCGRSKRLDGHCECEQIFW